MPPEILVVSADIRRLTTLLTMLRRAGYAACGASTFAEAKQLLGDAAPELLIADERLGAFNGLHVAILGRGSDPATKAIVISRAKDATLEKEARRLNVPCLVEPETDTDWLESISRMLADIEPAVTVH
jgi:DNA-binding NtrC family response regulator